MPKFMDQQDITGLRGYAFSAVRADSLGASEYTLATIAVDVSGSVAGFRDLLVETIKKTVAACRKSPRAANIMLRVITFSNGLNELHGFKPLQEIDDADYDKITVGGMTALYDACATSIGAMTQYGRTLSAQDYGVNGILFVITDGSDNISQFTADTVRSKSDEAVSGEVLESFLSVLVGVNAASYAVQHADFQARAGITQYVDAGAATPGNLAKLAAFVSRSVSSQASNLGAGAVPVSLVI